MLVWYSLTNPHLLPTVRTNPSSFPSFLPSSLLAFLHFVLHSGASCTLHMKQHTSHTQRPNHTPFWRGGSSASLVLALRPKPQTLNAESMPS